MDLLCTFNLVHVFTGTENVGDNFIVSYVLAGIYLFRLKNGISEYVKSVQS